MTVTEMLTVDDGVHQLPIVGAPTRSSDMTPSSFQVQEPLRLPGRFRSQEESAGCNGRPPCGQTFGPAIGIAEGRTCVHVGGDLEADPRREADGLARGV
jgi:hypothetical protein